MELNTILQKLSKNLNMGYVNNEKYCLPVFIK